jgi:prepilin-type N-terminal cleavage/methylation domain-containing protein
MRTPHSNKGITLVEMLIASAILGVILAALTGLFSSSSNAMQSNKTLSDQQQNAAVSEQVLKYELGLAGYRGVSQDDLDNNTFSGTGQTLLVTKGIGTASDSIRVRYFEDRLYGEGSEDVLRDVTFAIGPSNGKSYLTRQEGSGTASPLVEGVTKLKITNYVKRNGEVIPAGNTIPNTLVGLRLTLGFSDAPDKTIFVSFQNPQLTSSTTQTATDGQ